MALAVESPAREDLSFRTNDDKLVGARWLKSDGTTPIVIDSAALTLRFDPPPRAHDPYVEPLIVPVPIEHRITSTDPADPNGWISVTNLAEGVVLVTIPHTIWAAYPTRTGSWDLVADGEDVHRCLVRGSFLAEEGLS